MKALHSKFSDDEDNGANWSSSRAEDEDDIPLAQRIPGALQAQKSIRIRNRAYSTRAKSEAEANTRTKQSPFEVTELTRKLVKLSDRPSTQPANGTGTRWSARESSQSNSIPPPSLLPIPSSLLNVSGESQSRPRNKSFSQQSTPDINLISKATLLSRSTTQSAPKTSPRTVQTSVLEQFSTESSAIKPIINPPSRSQTDPVRSRSKSFSSLSKNTESFPRSIDQTHQPPLPLPNPRPINISQLQIPLQSNGNVVQQRIFINTMQRFNTVQIHAQTCAYEIITKIATQGELGSRGVTDASEDWMLWEIAQDFGLERPIRHYERPNEIYASWNSNTRLNAFMLRRTPLCSVLSPDRIPNSSPTCSGYVQWETKRGKWNKRWMELKEHSIWLSKRNTGKDRTFLCSLSSFDCYFMSRPYKAPKVFVFALKSTDNLTMFEDPADYLHIFSCDQGDGPRWTQSILLARSYILHKERTVLFTSPTSSTIPTPIYSHDHREHKSLPVPRKPFLDLGTRSGSSGSNKAKIFQSGSLLARS